MADRNGGEDAPGLSYQQRADAEIKRARRALREGGEQAATTVDFHVRAAQVYATLELAEVLAGRAELVAHG
jgi:hypothetical protein